MDRIPLFLASKSPRRQELLKQINVKFQLLDIEIDESTLENEAPFNYVKRMAVEKAQAGWQKIVNQTEIDIEKVRLLAADTCVVIDEHILGKPDNPQESKQMLHSLSNKTHQVMTCVALSCVSGIDIRTSITDVKFCLLSESMIETYINTQEGLDKAGSYAIQGQAAKFVESIHGSYSGVVGLPLYETSQLLGL